MGSSIDEKLIPPSTIHIYFVRMHSFDSPPLFSLQYHWWLVLQANKKVTQTGSLVFSPVFVNPFLSNLPPRDSPIRSSNNCSLISSVIFCWIPTRKMDNSKHQLWLAFIHLLLLINTIPLFVKIDMMSG